MRTSPVVLSGLLVIALITATVPAPAGADSGLPAIVAPAGNSLADIRATLELPAATTLNDRNGNKVFDSLEARFLANPLGTQPVIVTFRDGVDVAAALERAESVAGPLDPRYVYRQVGGFAADLDWRQVLAIAALSEIRQVEWSQPGTPELDTSTIHMGVRAVQEELGFTGARSEATEPNGDDVVIAVLDTGIDGDHVDLQGKVLRFIDWSDGGAEVDPYDSGDHGSHVAGIAGGLGIGDPRYTGVAPGAALVGFQISSSDTKGAAIASLDWILEHRNETRVDIATISFGFGITSDGTDALELAMDRAWEAGVVTFKSTGNSGPEQGTVTIPGGARGILSIGSMFDPDEGGARLSSFSSRGPTADGRIKPDLVAPGSSIMAVQAGTGNGYSSKSGTSMASPFAAGVAALLLSADPQLGNEDVRRILYETAQDWGPEGANVDYGHGRIDALRAVQTALVERAVREGWPHERLAAFDMELEHGFIRQHGAIGPTGALLGTRSVASNSFEVESADRPVGLTVIHAGDQVDLGVAVLRVIVVQVLGPDDTVVGELSMTPQSRQQTFSFQPTQAGTHTVEVTGLVGEERLFFDASGAVPMDRLGRVIPAAEEYVVQEGDASVSRDTPAGALLPVLALLGAAMVLLRRHDDGPN